MNPIGKLTTLNFDEVLNPISVGDKADRSAIVKMSMLYVKMLELGKAIPPPVIFKPRADGPCVILTGPERAVALFAWARREGQECIEWDFVEFPEPIDRPIDIKNEENGKFLNDVIDKDVKNSEALVNSFDFNECLSLFEEMVAPNPARVCDYIKAGTKDNN